jgi:hypothetical protein
MHEPRTPLPAGALGHLDALCNLARWPIRDPVEAEDLVQEAYLREATLPGASAAPQWCSPPSGRNR